MSKFYLEKQTVPHFKNPAMAAVLLLIYFFPRITVKYRSSVVFIFTVSYGEVIVSSILYINIKNKNQLYSVGIAKKTDKICT